MSKKPKRFLLILGFISVPLIGGFSYWWLTTPNQTLTKFIEALEKGDKEAINGFLEIPYQIESSGDKLGFIGFEDKSPKRKLKIWQDALKKALKVNERNMSDLITGQAQATLRVQSTVFVNMRFSPNNPTKNKGLEPKTLNLTITVTRNKISLKQKLEEPDSMGYYRTTYKGSPTSW